jgi:outer membrane protein insertion porin family
MRLLLGVALAVLAVSGRVFAQDASSKCAKPDSVAIAGNSRVDGETIRSSLGILPGAPLTGKQLQDGVKALFGTGQFDDVQVTCALVGPKPTAVLTVTVKERPTLFAVEIQGTKRLSQKAIRDRIGLIQGRPIDPGLVSRAITRIDSLYEANGYYLAMVVPETTFTKSGATLTFKIDEGHRLAVSGVEVQGATGLKPKEVVGAMKTKPEGFLFYRKGEFDEDAFAADLAERIPDLYASQGYIDFQIMRDTLIIDRSRGKALIDITVNEGRQYKVGSFDVIGNRRFSSDEIDRYYPFHGQTTSLTTRAARLITGKRTAPSDVFDRSKWDDATTKLRTAYANEGYIYASIRPIADRVVGSDSLPRVNLRWDIDEKSPAIINRIEIVGNDYTTENCIRDALVIIPGDVFSQDRLIRSYQNLGNLGFFDTPIPPPDTRPAGDQGDVDLIFHVKEKRTGNINFGASTGQGTGVGGFIGLDQPNLFGECKRGSIQWQFGRYINDLTASYTDPTLFQSRVSGTLTAYHAQSRYTIGNLGQSTRTGGNVQFGVPILHSLYTRLFVSYGYEAVSYNGDTTSLLGSLANHCPDCTRSVFGISLNHDTRVDMPFPSAGGLQTISADFNTRIFGGGYVFQRYITELRGYATLLTFGGGGIGSSPIKLVAGFKARAGAVFGNTGPFFYSQGFALGGTQYGEQLRGYDEFSITPQGYVTGTSTFNATQASFGNAFFTTTSELGLRFNSSIYLDTFLDAGNLYQDPRDFNPGRLYRGAGIGISVVTPLGPLGLDEAYGFDRLNSLGQPAPGWKTHFRLGQIF